MPERRISAGVVRRGLGVVAMAIRGEPRPFAVAVAGAALYAGATVGSAAVFGAITDRVILPSLALGRAQQSALLLAAAAVIGVSVVKSVGIVARRAGAYLMMYRLQATYRRRVVERYTRLSLSWHRRHSTGGLLSNANADVEATFFVLAPLPLSVGVVVLLVITGVALIATDPVLAMAGFVAGPLLGWLNYRYNARVIGPAQRAQELRAGVSSVAHESLDGALMVKTLGLEQRETDRFQAASERLRDELIGLGRIRAVFDPMLEALPNIAVLVVLAVGTARIAGGALTEGELVEFAYLFTLVAFPIRAIGWVLAELPRSVVGWDRVRAVLDSREEQSHGALRLARDGPALVEVRDVAYRYDSEPDDGDRDRDGLAKAGQRAEALHDVTLGLRPGATVALVGPTGAGKSTLASLLVRLVDPQRGQVTLDGVDLRQLAPGVLPSQTALVAQHTFLFDDTVRENITLGEPFAEEDVAAAAQLAQAHDFVTRLPFGYDTVIGERGTTLSGGQRQRLALARALIRRPRLLVLDDATSSVDPSVEADILAGLRVAALPSTVLMVAYREAAVALADEVVHLRRGTVAGRGTHRELLASDREYARLFTGQVVP